MHECVRANDPTGGLACCNKTPTLQFLPRRAVDRQQSSGSAFPLMEDCVIFLH